MSHPDESQIPAILQNLFSGLRITVYHSTPEIASSQPLVRDARDYCVVTGERPIVQITSDDPTLMSDIDFAQSPFDDVDNVEWFLDLPRAYRFQQERGLLISQRTTENE